MTLTVTHTFVSPILDQGDPTLLGPNEWNDGHATSMATNKLLGRGTAATGAIEEITLGTNLSFTGTTLNAAGAPGGSNTQVQYNNSSAFGGDASFTYGGNGAVTVGTAGHTGSVAFKGTTSGTVTVKPLDTAGTWTFKWPNSAGTNGYVLQTDGSGNTSWVLQTGSTGSLTVGTTTISGGTDKHVVYDNAGVVGEAANFTIESGNPNVTAGNTYKYDSTEIIKAQISLNNYYEGGAGNLTGTGTNNFATGAAALGVITTGNANVGFGVAALQLNTSGSQNLALGNSALNGNVSGDNNVGIGQAAGSAIASRVRNIAIGSQAGQAMTGDDNISIGFNCAQLAAFTNTCIGNSVMQTGTGNFNVCIGTSQAGNMTSGSQNTLVGTCPTGGNSLTSGSQNIVLGYDCSVATATASGQLTIGNYIYGTGLTATGATISTAKIGLGVKAPANELDVAGAISLTTFIEGTEMAAPAAPAANGFRIFAQDNGAGKTQLMVIFNTGAAQQLAIQP